MRHLATRHTMLFGGMIVSLAHAPNLAGQGVSPGLLASLDTVNQHLVRSAELVPEARFAYSPASGTRTFLQVIAHVADGNNYYCRLAAGEQIEWSEMVERSVKTKTEAVAALRASVDACAAVQRRADARPGPLIENLAHASLHYGNVVVYLRTMGLTPPSS